LVFYLHPWEFDPEQPVLPARGRERFRHYFNLKKTESKFNRLLNDYEFGTLQSFAASLSLDDVRQDFTDWITELS